MELPQQHSANFEIFLNHNVCCFTYILFRFFIRKITISLFRPCCFFSIQFCFSQVFERYRKADDTMTISKNNKMMAHLNFRMKVVLQDGRTFVGYFKGFFFKFFIDCFTWNAFRRMFSGFTKLKKKFYEEKKVSRLALKLGPFVSKPVTFKNLPKTWNSFSWAIYYFQNIWRVKLFFCFSVLFTLKNVFCCCKTWVYYRTRYQVHTNFNKKTLDVPFYGQVKRRRV